jgi:ankyrin repeat protein
MNIKEINEAEPGLLYTPLHVACRMDMPKAVEELLKIDGIDLSAKTRYGRTAFMLAIRCCSVESLKVIMEDSRFYLDSLESVEKIIGTVNNRYGMMCKENEINKIRELIKKFIEKKKKIESKPKDTKKDDQQETKIKEIHDNVKKNKDNIDVSKLKNEYEQTKNREFELIAEQVRAIQGDN